MPHPRILAVLGMTKEDWGKLPPEMNTIGAQFGCSNERKELREKALAIIREQDAAAAKGSLEARIAALEAKLGGNTE